MRPPESLPTTCLDLLILIHSQTTVYVYLYHFTETDLREAELST